VLRGSADATRPAGPGRFDHEQRTSIVDVADELDAAVIVISSRGLSGLKEIAEGEPFAPGRPARWAAGADRAAAAA
jgi:hypothetical protein